MASAHNSTSESRIFRVKRSYKHYVAALLALGPVAGVAIAVSAWNASAAAERAFDALDVLKPAGTVALAFGSLTLMAARTIWACRVELTPTELIVATPHWSRPRRLLLADVGRIELIPARRYAPLGRIQALFWRMGRPDEETVDSLMHGGDPYVRIWRRDGAHAFDVPPCFEDTDEWFRALQQARRR
jgi:hypothetical protein